MHTIDPFYSLRDELVDLLKRGKSMEDATCMLESAYRDYLEDSDDGPKFWIALANAQWSLGRLQSNVKQNALEYICELSLSCNAAEERKHLEEMRLQILSSQPAPKRISPYRFYRCPWNIGDIFAFPCKSSRAVELNRGYIVFQKVNEAESWPGHINPIVRIKLSDGAALPQSQAAFDRLPYLRISSTKYEDRFLPFDADHTYEEQIAQRSLRPFFPDKNGLLAQYQLKLYIKSNREVPSDLLFLGNHPKTVPPVDEFVPWSTDNIQMVSFRNFENTVINKYLHFHNED